jgi:hypothetical protein
MMMKQPSGMSDPSAAAGPFVTARPTPIRGHASGVFGILAVLFGLAGVGLFAVSKSAVYKTEGLVCLLISAVFGVGSIVVSYLWRLLPVAVREGAPYVSGHPPDPS